MPFLLRRKIKSTGEWIRYEWKTERRQTRSFGEARGRSWDSEKESSKSLAQIDSRGTWNPVEGVDRGASLFPYALKKSEYCKIAEETLCPHNFEQCCQW